MSEISCVLEEPSVGRKPVDEAGECLGKLRQEVIRWDAGLIRSLADIFATQGGSEIFWRHRCVLARAEPRLDDVVQSGVLKLLQHTVETVDEVGLLRGRTARRDRRRRDVARRALTGIVRRRACAPAAVLQKLLQRNHDSILTATALPGLGGAAALSGLCKDLVENSHGRRSHAGQARYWALPTFWLRILLHSL